MKTTNKKNTAMILAFAVLFVPMMAYGASLVPCGQPAGTPDIIVGGATYQTTNECGFNDLIVLANTIVRFLMYDVAVPLAAIGFMWAGGNLVLNQDKEGAWSDAKERFGNIAKGFGIMLGAYVLIKFVLYTFLNQAGGYTLFLLQ